jgi:hypothetical protein
VGMVAAEGTAVAAVATSAVRVRKSRAFIDAPQ